MERLTTKRQLKYGTANCLSTEYVSRPIASNGDEIVFGEAIDRLAAYEDTGYEPGQFETAMDAIKAHLWDVEQELKAYKDTGLAPEEVKDLIYRFEKRRAVRVALCDSTGQPIAEPFHIRNLLQAEKDGRLVLPCKVGDILHEVDLPEYGVITCKAVSISYYNGPMFHVPGNEAVKSLTVEVEVIDGHGKGSSYSFEIEDFGKHVFLTREAAETALREVNENA